MRRLACIASALLVASALAQQPYPIFETDKLPPAEYKARRERLMQQMGPGSMAVLFTSPTRNRNNDVDYLYRGDSNFLYLTGCEEPDSALVLAPDGITVNGVRVREVLFVRAWSQPVWTGYVMGPDNAKRVLGIEAALVNNEFARQLPLFAAEVTGKKVSTTRIPSDANGTLARMTTAFNEWRRDAAFIDGINLRNVLGRMREIKSPAEVALIRKASEISARAHIEAIKSIEPGMREFEISALVKYIFEKEGCAYTGYPPICGSGPNSIILHYDSNRRLMQSGDIMCMDTAGEYHGYSSDVTRSFPVNGKFTPEQRAIYDIVLASQEAGIAACKPGTTTQEVGRICSDKLAEGLMRLGIIKERRELGQYYMHGFGHGVGLDVHDPMPNTLAPGAVLTVEPGLYIREGSPCDPKWWNIGIRIEDVIHVTPNGPENLSALCPKKPDEIEKLARQKGIGNQAHGKT